jgi:hypothetical protein
MTDMIQNTTSMPLAETDAPSDAVKTGNLENRSAVDLSAQTSKREGYRGWLLLAAAAIAALAAGTFFLYRNSLVKNPTTDPDCIFMSDELAQAILIKKSNFPCGVQLMSNITHFSVTCSPGLVTEYIQEYRTIRRDTCANELPNDKKCVVDQLVIERFGDLQISTGGRYTPKDFKTLSQDGPNMDSSLEFNISYDVDCKEEAADLLTAFSYYDSNTAEEPILINYHQVSGL